MSTGRRGSPHQHVPAQVQKVFVQGAFTQLWKTACILRVTYPSRPVESSSTALAVDPCGVVSAPDTDSAPSFLPVDVETEWQVCYRLIKVALLCLTMAVTLCRHKETVGTLFHRIVKSSLGGVLSLIQLLPPHKSFENKETSESCFKDSALRTAHWPWAMCYLKGPKTKSPFFLSLSSHKPPPKVYN